MNNSKLLTLEITKADKKLTEKHMTYLCMQNENYLYHFDNDPDDKWLEEYAETDLDWAFGEGLESDVFPEGVNMEIVYQEWGDGDGSHQEVILLVQEEGENYLYRFVGERSSWDCDWWNETPTQVVPYEKTIIDFKEV